MGISLVADKLDGVLLGCSRLEACLHVFLTRFPSKWENQKDPVLTQDGDT